MATSYQDDFVKTALRLPRELHARLMEASREKGQSFNSELIDRLERSFAIGASSETLSTLVADLAKAKKDAAHLAYGRQEKLLQLMLLYDLYRDAVDAAEALGVPRLLPQPDLDLADSLGSETDQELARQDETFEPYFLFDGVKMSEQQWQQAIAKLTEFAAGQRAPSADDSAKLQALRSRIRQRRKQEHAEGKFIRDPSNEDPIEVRSPEPSKRSTQKSKEKKA